MASSHYRFLLFDLDDTLWNFKENSKVALQNIFDQYNLQHYYSTFDAYFNCFEAHNKILWRLYGMQQITKSFLHVERFLAPLRPFGILDTSLATEMGTAYLDRCAEETATMPHAIETLQYLQPRYDLSIISNGFGEVQYKKLHHSGLSPYFQHVFLSETIGYHKPKPEFFVAVLRELGASKEECLVIGDNYEVDIQGAMDFGLDQVYYIPDEQSFENKSFSTPPTFVIHDLASLCSLLK
jgi:putative hydrolase of the HAD superfamily